MNEIYDRGPFMIASAPARHIVYENLYKEKIHAIFVDHAERNKKFLQELVFS